MYAVRRRLKGGVQMSCISKGVGGGESLRKLPYLGLN